MFSSKRILVFVVGVAFMSSIHAQAESSFSRTEIKQVSECYLWQVLSKDRSTSIAKKQNDLETIHNILFIHRVTGKLIELTAASNQGRTLQTKYAIELRNFLSSETTTENEKRKKYRELMTNCPSICMEIAQKTMTQNSIAKVYEQTRKRARDLFIAE